MPTMNTLMLAHKEPAQNKPRVRYAFLGEKMKDKVDFTILENSDKPRVGQPHGSEMVELLTRLPAVKS